MAISDAYAHGKDTNPRAGGRNLPAGAIKATDIRRQVDDWKDPYLREEEQPARPSRCGDCGAVFANGRWYDSDSAPFSDARKEQLPSVICPADRRAHDRYPGGIVSVSGAFFAGHRQVIEDLIHNEEKRARGHNPMERIMHREEEDGSLNIQTTNPKLAQRIGHALEKAYHGETEYKWSADTHLVRVSWRRD